jgi:hypothetical protein
MKIFTEITITKCEVTWVNKSLSMMCGQCIIIYIPNENLFRPREAGELLVVLLPYILKLAAHIMLRDCLTQRQETLDLPYITLLCDN